MSIDKNTKDVTQSDETKLKGTVYQGGSWSFPLPSGGATSAKQDTIIGHIDDLESSLASILTELQGKADLVDTQPVSVASLPLPSGASTSAKQDTIIGHIDGIEALIAATNALLTTIDADTGSLAAEDFATETTLSSLNAKVVSVNTGAVVVSSSALPSGAATSAKQDTIIGHVDGIEALLTTLAGTVTGTELQVDVLTMPTVTISDGGGSITVDGSVTANAGTNLNTSALALESGGNLAAIAASLAVLDDWDETDRAKVNIIVGQAGVAAGAGAVAATVQRMTLASDDPAVVALQIMDDWDESDRAKANIIVGQAGITAGAGAVAANTPRFTHASDDPVVTALQIMDDWDESDRAKVNPIVGQAGVAADVGASGATVQRIVEAYDTSIVPTRAAYTGSNSNVSLGGAVSGSQKQIVYFIKVTAGGANLNYPAVRIGFGSASTPTTTAIASHPGVVPGSGFVVAFPKGIVGALDEELRITSDDPNGQLDVVFYGKVV